MADTPTTAREVFDSFEASFQDKCIIPEEVEKIWLLRAIGRYSVELKNLPFDADSMTFETVLDRYTIDLLAAYMKQSYQEREVSKVNKRISIVSKDLSLDGSGTSKSAAKNELLYDQEKSHEMTDNLKPTVYV